MDKEQYEIKKLFSFDNAVIPEAVWKGALSAPIGTYRRRAMTAHFAGFLNSKMAKSIGREIMTALSHLVEIEAAIDKGGH